MTTSSISAIIDALEPATSQAYWDAVRSAWIRFNDHKQHAEESARLARKVDSQEMRKALIGIRDHDYNFAEKAHAEAIELGSPFWKAYGQLREVAPLLLADLPILSDDDPTTYEPRTLALAVRSVVSRLRAMDAEGTTVDSRQTTREPSLDTMLLELLKTADRRGLWGGPDSSAVAAQ